MRWISLTATALCLCLFASVFAQEKKIDTPAPKSSNKTFIDGLAETELSIKQATLKAHKRNLETIQENHKTAYKVLAHWKRMVEKYWATATKEEKAKMVAFSDKTGGFLLSISNEPIPEVLGVAVTALDGKKIAEPTKLQRKILTSAGQEKDEAKRVALTIHECLRFIFERVLFFDDWIDDLDSELQSIKKEREALSAKKHKK